MFTAMIALAAAAALPGSAAAPKSAPSEVATPSGSETTAARPNLRYCTVEVPTGSHLRVKTCKSRQEWLDLGFDPVGKK